MSDSPRTDKLHRPTGAGGKTGVDSLDKIAAEVRVYPLPAEPQPDERRARRRREESPGDVDR
ncbi:MAG: hypothetical protein WKH64_13785 [Chloroflexia bacterium]